MSNYQFDPDRFKRACESQGMLVIQRGSSTEIEQYKPDGSILWNELYYPADSDRDNGPFIIALMEELEAMGWYRFEISKFALYAYRSVSDLDAVLCSKAPTLTLQVMDCFEQAVGVNP